MDDQVLRYAMKMLSPVEAAGVEARLAADNRLQKEMEQIRQTLARLETIKEPISPSPGLARKTIQRARANVTRTLPFPAKTLNTHAPRQFKRWDVLLAASMLILVGGLFFPWLHTARAEAEKKACAMNLSHYWKSLQHFASLHPEGAFPKVEASGSKSFAGVFVSTLRQHGLLGDHHSILCPSDTRKTPVHLDANQLAALFQQEDKDPYHLHTREAAGDYAYPLGYMENGELKGLKRDSGDHVPLMADKAGHIANANSSNHGGLGQNTLFIGGQVHWLNARKYLGDDIFLNQEGKLRAGKHSADHVLGPSHSRPFSHGDD